MLLLFKFILNKYVIFLKPIIYMQLLTYFQGITLDFNVSCDKSKRISTQMQAGDFLKYIQHV